MGVNMVSMAPTAPTTDQFTVGAKGKYRASVSGIGDGVSGAMTDTSVVHTDRDPRYIRDTRTGRMQQISTNPLGLMFDRLSPHLDWSGQYAGGDLPSAEGAGETAAPGAETPAVTSAGPVATPTPPAAAGTGTAVDVQGL